MLVGDFFFSNWLVLLMRHNWRVTLETFCRLKFILNQFFPVALSVIFKLVYAKCNFASVLKKISRETEQNSTFVYPGLLAFCMHKFFLINVCLSAKICAGGIFKKILSPSKKC